MLLLCDIPKKKRDKLFKALEYMTPPGFAMLYSLHSLFRYAVDKELHFDLTCYNGVFNCYFSPDVGTDNSYVFTGSIEEIMIDMVIADYEEKKLEY